MVQCRVNLGKNFFWLWSDVDRLHMHFTSSMFPSNSSFNFHFHFLPPTQLDVLAFISWSLWRRRLYLSISRAGDG
jgi:hypothetical protein